MLGILKRKMNLIKTALNCQNGLQRQEKEANEEAEALRKNLEQETENLVTQAGAAKSSSTNIFSTVSTTAKASGTNLVNTVSIPVSTAITESTTSQEDDSEIPPLEDIHEDTTDGIFTHSSYDDEGAEADFTNLETVVNVSPIPTSRINPSHPSALILADPTSAVQTRSKVNKSSEAHAFAKIKKLKQQATPVIKHFKEYLKTVSLQKRIPKKSSSKKQRMHKKNVSKQGRKIEKGESSVQRDPMFDVMPENNIDHMEAALVSTDGSKVSTDEQIEGADDQVEGTEENNEEKEEIFEGTEDQRESTEDKVSTDEQMEGTEAQYKEENASQASQTSTLTPSSVIFGDDET
ncbi:hypothetical protein Tco_0049041, partial [Tanacetum coccineum]